MGERRAVLIVLLILCGIMVIFPNNATVRAITNPIPFYLLEMPEEYIDYVICWVNGTLWAKMDGTYPIYVFNIDHQDQVPLNNSTGFTFSGDTLPMVYPTPPGTTNISLKMDEKELQWSNYTQIYPHSTHYTALGNWTMISSTIDPILDYFTLKIHYEHPIMRQNGSFTFLYDLNISPYLSPWGNKSTAYFKIRFETDITDPQATTISTDGTMKSVEYKITKEDTTETVSLQVVSEYSKPLLGDLLISFTESKELEQTNSSFLGSSLRTEYGTALVVVILIALVAMNGYLFLKRNAQDE